MRPHPIRSTAIRDYCKACCDKPRECELTKCALYRFRMGNEDKAAKGRRITRGEAIKQFCRDCMGGQRIVGACTAPECKVFPFRV